MAPFFSSACPRSLAAWSSRGTTRDMMQDVTVGKVNEDSSCPGGSFGAAASSHRQKEPMHSGLGCCTGAEKWKSDGTVWELQAGNNQKRNGNSQSKACLTQVMLFSRKSLFDLKSIKEQRAQVPECCISEHTLSRGGSRALAQGRPKLMNLESQRLWSLTGIWDLLWSIEWNLSFRGPDIPEFSITQWHLISSLRWDNPCTSCTLTPGTTADPARPAEAQVLNFKTSLFPLFLALQRAEGALAAAKGSVCSQHVSPSQAARTPHTWLAGKDRRGPSWRLVIHHKSCALKGEGRSKLHTFPAVTQSGGPASPVFLGDHPKPALDNSKSAPALGYGEATSAELPREKVGKEKGIQCSGQRRRKEQAKNQIWKQWNPVVCSSWRSGVNRHPRN